MKLKKIIFITTILIFISTYTLAHEGIFINRDISSIEKSWKIEDIQHSKAIYSQLQEELQVDYYRFQGLQEEEYYSQVLIPQIEGNHNFMVTKLLIGENLPSINEQYNDIVPSGYGAIPVEPGNSREEFFEPFTQTSYYKKQQFSFQLEEDGTYYIAVFNSHGQTGKYVLTLGEEEDMSFMELITYPVTWFKVNWWFNPFRPIVMMIIIGGLIFLCIKVIQGIRNKKS
ncbi:hypothetical protein PRVXT_001952 [Proteinivorax tanatarense]|uniref:PepSY domain-containing protein n=1 Tax=Proteinivorax tanatarense TaxID=1260629 RepID=A0AAU7VJ79_9FIRM